MNTKRQLNIRHLLFFIPIIVVVSALLAPTLWRGINKIIIQPVVYYWWMVKQFLRIAPQTFYWYFWVGGMGLVTLISLLRHFRNRNQPDERNFVQEGQLKSLASMISRVDKSHYMKWLVANRLATIALDLIKHDTGTSGNKAYQFPEVGWDPPDNIKNYFDAGLDNAHMSISSKRMWFKRKDQSPLDADLTQVIQFIESQMEKS